MDIIILILLIAPFIGIIIFLQKLIKKNKEDMKKISERLVKNEKVEGVENGKIAYRDYKWANYILGGLGIILGVVGIINYYTGGGYFLGLSIEGFIGNVIEGIIILVLGYFVGKTKSIAFLLTAIIFLLEVIFKFGSYFQNASVGLTGVFIYGYAAWAFLKAYSSIGEQNEK